MKRTKAPQPHLGLLLERASRVVAERLAQDIGRDGVTADHWRVLRDLADGEGHAMGEIAGRHAIHPPTLTKLVDRMVSMSLVQRAADPADSRRVLVYATDGGLELLGELESSIEAHHAALDALLGPRNTRQLERLLTMLIDGAREQPAA